MDYSHGIKDPKCLAPARTQFLASTLMPSSTVARIEDLFWNTLAFLSFQTSQETSIISEEIVFLRCPRPRIVLVHHSWIEEIPTQSAVSSSGVSSQHLTTFQMRMKNLHWNIMCAAVSGSLLQSWHKLQFGHPRRCSRSAVQTLFLLMSHAKNLHLGGA